MSIYDIARDLQIAGVVVQAHIDPKQVSVRIKNAAQRMIRSGVLKGGWNSKSRKLAYKLVENTNAPVLRSMWREQFAIDPLPPEAIERLDEMFEADIALSKMRTDFDALGDWAREHYHRNWNASLRDNKAAIRRLSRTPTPFYLSFDAPEYRKEAYDYIMSFATADDKAELNRIADLLDGETPIPITWNH